MSSRYAKEFHRLKQSLEKKTNGQAFIKDWNPDNITTFIVEVSPKGGPYQKGRFLFQIIVPDLYPDVHPDVVCLTDIYHPNIDSEITDEHNICLNLFDEWNKSFGLEDCVQGLIFLLYNPNLSDPISSLFDGSEETQESFALKVQASLRGESFDGISFAKNPGFSTPEGNGKEEKSGAMSAESAETKPLNATAAAEEGEISKSPPCPPCEVTENGIGEKAENEEGEPCSPESNSNHLNQRRHLYVISNSDDQSSEDQVHISELNAETFIEWNHIADEPAEELRIRLDGLRNVEKEGATVTEEKSIIPEKRVKGEEEMGLQTEEVGETNVQKEEEMSLGKVEEGDLTKLKNEEETSLGNVEEGDLTKLKKEEETKVQKEEETSLEEEETSLEEEETKVQQVEETSLEEEETKVQKVEETSLEEEETKVQKVEETSLEVEDRTREKNEAEETETTETKVEETNETDLEEEKNWEDIGTSDEDEWNLSKITVHAMSTDSECSDEVHHANFLPYEEPEFSWTELELNEEQPYMDALGCRFVYANQSESSGDNSDYCSSGQDDYSDDDDYPTDYDDDEDEEGERGHIIDLGSSRIIIRAVRPRGRRRRQEIVVEVEGGLRLGVSRALVCLRPYYHLLWPNLIFREIGVLWMVGVFLFGGERRRITRRVLR